MSPVVCQDQSRYLPVVADCRHQGIAAASFSERQGAYDNLLHS